MDRLLLTMDVVLMICILVMCSTIHGAKSLSIQSPDGDIIDCVDKKAQPSFSDPLLKGHQIHEKPTGFPNIREYEDTTKWQIWHRSGIECPEGTIPIRRFTTEVADVSAPLDHEYGTGSIKDPPKIYGTTVTMNVWKPSTEKGEFSLGQTWLVSGTYDSGDLNSIEAGWQVFPYLYKDNQPRFFIFWTRDAYTDIRCYNLRCPGFIQTSRTIAIEGAISPTSVVGGAQMDLTIQIWKDPKLAVWWLAAGFNNGSAIAPIGYWPIDIFTRLNEYAEVVQWGGEVTNFKPNGRHTTTEMGSGYFPSIGHNKAAYMKDIGIVVNKTTFIPVPNLVVKETNPKYYKAKKSGETSFYYGGQQRSMASPIRLDIVLQYTALSCLLIF